MGPRPKARTLRPIRCSAFGLDITSAIPLPGRWRASGAGLPPVSIEHATGREIDARWSGRERAGWEGRVDGRDFVVEHGRAGDLRMRLEPSTTLHLSGDGARLLVAEPAGDRPATLRLLLDSALFTVALRHGHEALHAGAVTTGSGALAVLGPAGAGKSSLVAALLRAGCEFHTDDVLFVRRAGDAFLAAPGPPVLTVPNPPPATIGEPIADLGGETWLAVAGARGEPPLVGIVELEPGAGAAQPARDWGLLLSQMLRFPRTPERERRRFELAADLAARVPRLKLGARSAPADNLSGSALAWLRSLPEL